MTYNRPAFSSAFSSEGIHILDPIESFEDVDAEWAWGGSTGKGVKVAVIDSGIDATHPGVNGPVQGYVEVGARGEEITYNTEPHSDPYSHGTACASIIRSFAPECELYSIKVIGADLIGRGQVFAAGLRWAIEHKMDVCNMSLGTTKKDFYGVLHQLTDAAYFNNVILVTAANNTPKPSFPSVYSSVISVGSHDVQDPYLFYYNPHPPVEFGASGINIRVAWLRGGWMRATGNSYATPHITGLVAKILGKHPNLTLFQVKSILRALSANIKREDRTKYRSVGPDGAASPRTITWKAWTSVPASFTTAVAPAAMTLPNGKLGVVATDAAEGTLRTTTYDGTSWSDWTALEPSVTTTVSPAAILNTSRTVVAATNASDERIYLNWFDEDKPGEWEVVEADLRTRHAPVLAMFGASMILIGINNADQRVLATSAELGIWNDWRDITEGLVQAASVTACPFAKKLYIFCHSSADEQVYLRTFDGKGFSAWVVVDSGEFTTREGVTTALFANKLFIFGRSSKDGLLYWTATDGMSWDTWQLITEDVASHGVTALSHDHRPILFSVDGSTGQVRMSEVA